MASIAAVVDPPQPPHRLADRLDPDAGLSGFCFAGAAMIVESWLNERASKENRGTIFSIYQMVNFAASTAGQLLMVDHARRPTSSSSRSARSSIASPSCRRRSRPPSTRGRSRPTRLDIRRLYRELAGLGGRLLPDRHGQRRLRHARRGLCAADRSARSPSVALLMAGAVLGGSLIQFPLGRFSDRMDRRKVLIGVAPARSSSRSSSSSSSRATRRLVIGLAVVFGASIYPMYAIAVAHANDFAAARRVREDRRRAPPPPRLRHHDRPDPRGAGDGAADAGRPVRLHRDRPSPPRPLHALPHVASAPRRPGRAARSSRACRFPRPRRRSERHARSAGAAENGDGVARADTHREPDKSPRRQPCLSCDDPARYAKCTTRSRLRTELPPRHETSAALGDTGEMEYFLQQLINGRHAWLDLRADRDRLHDGLRDHRHDQLRPWRHLHGRRVPGADRAASCIGVTAATPFLLLILALLVVLVVAMALTSVWGWTVERVAYRPLRGSFRLAPLITAIGMSIILQNFVQLVQGARVKPLPPIITRRLSAAREQQRLRRPALQHPDHHHRHHGASDDRASRCSSRGPRSAARSAPASRTRAWRRLLGVNVDRTISLTFVIGAGARRRRRHDVPALLRRHRFLYRLQRRHQSLHRRRARRHRLAARRHARRPADRPDRDLLVGLFLRRVQGRGGVLDPRHHAYLPALGSPRQTGSGEGLRWRPTSSQQPTADFTPRGRRDSRRAPRRRVAGEPPLPPSTAPANRDRRPAQRLRSSPPWSPSRSSGRWSACRPRPAPAAGWRSIRAAGELGRRHRRPCVFVGPPGA